MKIFILDTAGRNAVQYNPSLCSALSKQLPDAEVRLLSTDMTGKTEGFKFQHLLTLMPKSWASKSGLLKLILRALEAFLNYLYVIFIVAFSQPNILHFQWLVFIDKSILEKYYFTILKFVSPKMKLFLTVHNVYPHNIAEKKKEDYKRRFKELDKYFDGYLVHLKSAKELFASNFDIDNNKIFVAYHGIYKSTIGHSVDSVKSDDLTNIIMYGSQTRYKGLDILLEALLLLPKDILSKTKTKILGTSSKEFYNQCKEYLEPANATWDCRFVPDEELYKAIDGSDLILLPYRQISQSGVLLLALSYNKPILTSNLPSFLETLDGYPENYFFESENPRDLSEKIKDFVLGRMDKTKMIGTIKKLNTKYSWDETAKATLRAYGLK